MAVEEGKNDTEQTETDCLVFAKDAKGYFINDIESHENDEGYSIVDAFNSYYPDMDNFNFASI